MTVIFQESMAGPILFKSIKDSFPPKVGEVVNWYPYPEGTNAPPQRYVVTEVIYNVIGEPYQASTFFYALVMPVKE